MAPKFGNYLFRNLQDQPGKEGESVPVSPEAPALEDRVITLGEADFVSNEALVPALAWDRHPGRTVEVRLRDISGLTEGRVTIQAGVLRRAASDLVPANVPDDLQLPLSLRSVVMQIQPYLEQSDGGIPRPTGPDFDTPIAQVAREDEGFFKLEPSKGSAPAGPSRPAVDASIPAWPLIREKPAVMAGPPVAVVSRPTPAPPDVQPAPPLPENRPQHPFAGLPAVGPPSPPPEPARLTAEGTGPPAPAWQGGVGETQLPAPLPATAKSKPVRRVALERLQEVFMTEDLLDVGQVLRLIGAFPKVVKAFAVTGDGEVHGQGTEMLGTRLAPPSALLKAAETFARTLGLRETLGLTLLLDQPISVIGNDRLTLIIFHESRNLPPGMKDRLAVVAAALADLLAVEK